MSKTQNIIVAGFGGQGVLLLGKLIAMTGLEAGKEVSWIPSYGPEMRGGTANCTVRISDDPIGSPVVANPNILIALNLPSFDKFIDTMEPGGVLIYNRSLIDRETTRKDIQVISLPATELAKDKLDNTKLTNMILFGSYLKQSQLANKTVAFKALEESISKKHRDLIPANQKAIEIGLEFA